MHVPRLHYPSCWSKARLILTTPPLPPWAASWWQGCQHSFPVWGSWALFRVPLALPCSVRYFKQGSFPRFSCISLSLCPFLACSLRAAALQPSIYMALICLSLFGTYMAPIGPGPECLPIFNIFIFTHADTHTYLWGQEVPLLLLYRWRTLNGNWLNWEQVVVVMEEGCLHMVQKWHHKKWFISHSAVLGMPVSLLICESCSQWKMRSQSCPIPVLASSILNHVLKFFCPSDVISEVKSSVKLPGQNGDGSWSPLNLTVKAKDLLMAGSFPLVHCVCCSWRGFVPLFSVAPRWGWAQQSKTQPSAQGLLCFARVLWTDCLLG